MIVYFKPVYGCNMRCSYCIVKNMEENKKTSLDFVLDLLSRYPDKTHVIFHGGEPTLKRPEYYKEIIISLKKRGFTFSMQTNLNIRNIEEWLEVFRELEYVSTSNDVVNRERKGMDEELWDKNVKFLLSRNIPVQVIITLHARNVSHIDAMKKFIMRYADYRSLFSFRVNYIKPYLDRTTELLIPPGSYAKVVIELDKFIRQKDLKVEFETIKSYAKALHQDISTECNLTSLCFNEYTMIDGEGRRFICSGLEELNISAPHTDRYFYLQQHDCKDCELFQHCQGGCVIDSITFYNNAYKKTPYCEDHKLIFKYVKQLNIQQSP
ncbi:MAG: radical SAM protein [Candidatus Bathyarchaeia archaeon]